MRLSTYIKIFLLTVIVGIGCGLNHTAKADVADIPRPVVNVFADGSFMLTDSLAKNGYKVGYAYNQKSLFARNPIIQDLPASPFNKSTVKQLGSSQNGRERMRKKIHQAITFDRPLGNYANTRVNLNFKNYFSSAAAANSELGLGQAYLDKYAKGNLNLEQKVNGTVITRHNRKQTNAKKCNIALEDMKVMTACSPIALAKRDNTVYVAFLEYSLHQVDVDEDEHTGRFGPHATNYESKWEKIYLLPIDKIYSPAPKN